MKLKRDFALEVFFAEWEFAAAFNQGGSDMESMPLAELLALANPAERERYESLSLGYTESPGAPYLREELAASFETLKASEILTFASAEEAIFTVMNVLMAPGEHAIITVPCYQSAETVPLSIGTASGLPLDPKNNWAFDPARLESLITPKTRLLYVNFPNNPTGKVISRADLEAAVGICRKHGVYLVSDEIFRNSEREHTKRLPQAADIYERGISLSGISKTYALPGLRVGWIGTPDKGVLDEAARFKHYLSICNPAPAEALTAIAIRNREALWARSRKLSTRYLAQLEAFFKDHQRFFEFSAPAGGYVAYPRYIGPGTASRFCGELLKATGVLLAPPEAFRSDLANFPADRFRIGFNRAYIEEVLKRMRAFLETEEPYKNFRG